MEPYRSTTGFSGRIAILALLIYAMLWLVAPAKIFAQATATVGSSGELRGRVLDASRSPIVAAKIEAVAERDRTTASAVSNQSGEFTLHLASGAYTLTINASGFAQVSGSIDMHDAASFARDFVLQVAGVRTAITVTEPSAYQTDTLSSSTKTLTPARDTPQSVTVVTKELMQDQDMLSIADVVRYMPGVTAIQGENNRDQLVIRGNSTSADFFLNGVRDDVQYYRDIYNVDRVEALKGSNTMVFGRGGGGGVINRVTKEAVFTPLHEVTLQGGSFNTKRIAGDFNQPLGSKWAARLNADYENSGTFRDLGHLERYGVNPTITFEPSQHWKLTANYEHFHDARGADRGIPSFQGRPADVPITQFFGDPNVSRVRADVNLGSATAEYHNGRLVVRDRLQTGGYDRGYQNFVPGAVNSTKTLVSLSAYNNATKRLNIFNQTELAYAQTTGPIRHTWVAGLEVGKQFTDNLRNTGFFNNATTTINVPYSDSVIATPVTFRQSATDANNHLVTNIVAAYLQDQVELSRKWQVIAGVRFDNFDLRFHNNRDGSNLRRVDNLVSPRAGIVYKPIAVASLYASYGVSYLPSSGDQFSSLTTITQQVKPEKFTNYEVGAKWDLRRSLSLTTALYRMDRTNTRSTDPNDPTRIIQTGGTRAYGYEIGLTGRVTRSWNIVGGYAYQNVFISSATTAALRGAQVGQVPHSTFSLWNRYQIVPRLGVGLGLLSRSAMFAAVDDTVTLPGYLRVDAAVYVTLTEQLRLQANVENMLNRKYYVNADSNTNISPGSPAAARVSLVARF